MSDLAPGPRLDAVVKEVTYEDGKITSLVLVNEADGEQWRIEGEMEVVDPYGSGEPIPDGGEPGGTIDVEATLEIGVMATVPTHATREETEQALYENVEDGRLDGVYIYDGPHADSPAKFEQWLDDNAPRTDGGVTVERDEPDLPELIELVLDDAAGGLKRQLLIERVAMLSGATLDEVEETLDAEIRHGRVIDADGEVRRENNRRFAGRAR